MVAKIKVTGPFNGPDFVKGLADTSKSYEVINSTTAVLTFKGGFDKTTIYTQTLTGTGFGVTSDGRFTGTVTSFVGVNENLPDTYWTISGLGAPLDLVNKNPAGGLNFFDLLISPLTYHFIGDKFDDLFILGPYNDVANGGLGEDNFTGLSGDDKLFGGPGDDFLDGDEGADLLEGGTGDDQIFGDIGRDTLLGHAGADEMHGGADADRMFGGSGLDTMSGDAGGDEIDGGRDRDIVSGGEGDDTVIGGHGDDELYGDEGDDTIRGGNGDDLIEGGVDGDTIHGDDGHDILRGQKGVDYLHGGKGGDSLAGGDGIDKLFGGKGSDRLAGGGGSDTIDGGAGNDLLSGNLSDKVDQELVFDTFIFTARFGHDIITDFHVGFDAIALAGGIKQNDVTVTENGDDVMITVHFLGKQTILVRDAADSFDPQIDIVFA